MEIKERIIVKATELFMKEGVRRVTMDHLAGALGMSKRTIYENYKNKDEILKECIETNIDYQKQAFLQMASNSETAVHLFFSLLKSGIENMKSHNPQFVNDVRIYYPLIWESTIHKNKSYNIEQTTNLLERGTNEGVFRDNIDIQIVAKLIIEFFTLLPNGDIFPPIEFPPSVIYEQTMIMMIRGIASSKGLKLIDELTNQK